MFLHIDSKFVLSAHAERSSAMAIIKCRSISVRFHWYDTSKIHTVLLNSINKVDDTKM